MKTCTIRWEEKEFCMLVFSISWIIGLVKVTSWWASVNYIISNWLFILYLFTAHHKERGRSQPACWLHQENEASKTGELIQQHVYKLRDPCHHHPSCLFTVPYYHFPINFNTVFGVLVSPSVEWLHPEKFTIFSWVQHSLNRNKKVLNNVFH